MYLTFPNSGYRFQIAISSYLRAIRGRTPIRVNLGRFQRRLPATHPVLLSGHSEAVLLQLIVNPPDAGLMTREMRKHTLETLAEEMQQLRSRVFELNMPDPGRG